MTSEQPTCSHCGRLDHDRCDHPLLWPDDPDHWSHGGADYDGSECKNCKRERVLCYGNDRRICEKCNWDQVLGEYAFDHERIG